MVDFPRNQRNVSCNSLLLLAPWMGSVLRPAETCFQGRNQWFQRAIPGFVHTLHTPNRPEMILGHIEKPSSFWGTPFLNKPNMFRKILHMASWVKAL